MTITLSKGIIKINYNDKIATWNIIAPVCYLYFTRWNGREGWGISEVTLRKLE